MAAQRIVHRSTALLLVLSIATYLLAAEPKSIDQMKLTQHAVLVRNADQLLSTAQLQPNIPWRPTVNTDLPRGPASEVYSKVAPATVVVRNDFGMGSGIVIDRDGWIVTNHHVIQLCDTDADTGAQVATVHFGRLDGSGTMRLVEDGLPALVYKSTRDKDLALLKLVKKPAGIEKLAAVPLAQSAAKPGDDCIVIGHPRAGMLWTVRRGTVTGRGELPKTLVQAVVARLAARTAEDRRKIQDALQSVPQVGVIISSCAINHGDSGGPLTDDKGALIGVTYAMPASEDEDSAAAKFGYHVDLEEVKQFVADRPKTPPLFIPSPWPMGVRAALIDRDDDGIPDLLAFANSADGPVTGILVDLVGANGGKGSDFDAEEFAAKHSWKFQFAMQRFPQARTFYDTDGDGTIDLVLLDRDRDGQADEQLKLVKGHWVRSVPKKQPMIDAKLFQDPGMRQRFVQLVK